MLHGLDQQRAECCCAGGWAGDPARSGGAEGGARAAGNVGGEPVQTLVQTLAGSGARALDVPVALAERVQPQLVGNLSSVHGVGEILLVGEHQQHGLAELILVEHAVKLVPGLPDTVAIVGVHNENQALRVLEVVPPEGTDLVLAADIPHGETDVLVLHGLDVEPDGGDGGDDLAELELVQNGGLTGRVKTHLRDRGTRMRTEEGRI
mmetsp:Transcript_42278/g.135353  ORF Transcript_42278/g.135353 Transcript_42278/m.135353 type:complete len:207 (+) Transcript_42278:281-901(+)